MAQRRVYSLCPGPLAEVDEWLSRYRTDHIAGRERRDGEPRWRELVPAYEDLATHIG